jgi:hypothetical protein
VNFKRPAAGRARSQRLLPRHSPALDYASAVSPLSSFIRSPFTASSHSSGRKTNVAEPSAVVSTMTLTQHNRVLRVKLSGPMLSGMPTRTRDRPD